MNFVYLETSRFTIRQWTPEDASALHGIMADARVHTYTGDKPWSMERAERYIKLMLEKDFRTLETFHGACILKKTGELVGFTGLNPYLPKQPELEWQLGVPHWGKGYASEIGKGVIEKAFETTDIERIYGMANPRNIGSCRALEKIGMTRLGLREFRGELDVFYCVERSEEGSQ
jgi:ribosomal-protein-alanine N-acetyltransferase